MANSDSMGTSAPTEDRAAGVGLEQDQQPQNQLEPEINHQAVESLPPDQGASAESQPQSDPPDEEAPGEEGVKPAAEEDEDEEERDQLHKDPSIDSSHRQSLTPASSSTPSIAIISLTGRTHPLKNPWTMWFLNNNKNQDWLQRLKEVCTITTVEEFWSLYDSIRPPSALFGCDYNLFKVGIKPIWEVPENKHGGRLVVQVDKLRQHEFLDQMWLELLIALIGDQFGGDTGTICGAVCNIRQKGSKICLWTTDNRNDEANRRIGGIMKAKLLVNLLGNKTNMRVCYEDHSDVQTKNSSSISARLVI